MAPRHQPTPPSNGGWLVNGNIVTLQEEARLRALVVHIHSGSTTGRDITLKWTQDMLVAYELAYYHHLTIFERMPSRKNMSFYLGGDRAPAKLRRDPRPFINPNGRISLKYNDALPALLGAATEGAFMASVNLCTLWQHITDPHLRNNSRQNRFTGPVKVVIPKDGKMFNLFDGNCLGHAIGGRKCTFALDLADDNMSSDGTDSGPEPESIQEGDSDTEMRDALISDELISGDAAVPDGLSIADRANALQAIPSDDSTSSDVSDDSDSAAEESDPAEDSDSPEDSDHPAEDSDHAEDSEHVDDSHLASHPSHGSSSHMASTPSAQLTTQTQSTASAASAPLTSTRLPTASQPHQSPTLVSPGNTSASFLPYRDVPTYVPSAAEIEDSDWARVMPRVTRTHGGADGSKTAFLVIPFLLPASLISTSGTPASSIDPMTYTIAMEAVSVTLANYHRDHRSVHHSHEWSFKHKENDSSGTDDRDDYTEPQTAVPKATQGVNSQQADKEVDTPIQQAATQHTTMFQRNAASTDTEEALRVYDWAFTNLTASDSIQSKSEALYWIKDAMNKLNEHHDKQKALADLASSIMNTMGFIHKIESVDFMKCSNREMRIWFGLDNRIGKLATTA